MRYCIEKTKVTSLSVNVEVTVNYEVQGIPEPPETVAPSWVGSGTFTPELTGSIITDFTERELACANFMNKRLGENPSNVSYAFFGQSNPLNEIDTEAQNGEILPVTYFPNFQSNSYERSFGGLNRQTLVGNLKWKKTADQVGTQIYTPVPPDEPQESSFTIGFFSNFTFGKPFYDCDNIPYGRKIPCDTVTNLIAFCSGGFFGTQTAEFEGNRDGGSGTYITEVPPGVNAVGSFQMSANWTISVT